MSMKSSITDSVKLPIFALSMISVNRSFKAAVLFFFLAAALVFSSFPAFADFQSDSSIQINSFAVSPVDALGTAYITRAALGALGVELASSSLDLSSDDVARAMWYGGGSTLPPSYTFAQNLIEYFSRQTIRIRPDSVTIGGVEYSDVWLPHDAADKFRTNAFDFITRYNISSESVGTFVSGVGNVFGVPVFYDGSSYFSQKYLFGIPGTYVVADNSIFIGSNPYTTFTWTFPSGSIEAQFLAKPTEPYNFTGVWECDTYSGGTRARFVLYASRGSDTIYKPTNFVNGSFTLEPFDFTWAATTIPLTPLPGSYGLRARIPSTYVQDLPQILDPNSETYESDLARFTSAVETAASEGTLTDPAFEEWDTPVPPVSNTIANEPYSSLSGALSGISSFLGSISSSVSQVAEAVISGDVGFFGNIVSALAAPFEPVFAIFRSGVGIWHYVVSWVGTISSPFSWSLSALGGAGSYFLSPLYAAAAAAVVLAVYKKFGR